MLSKRASKESSTTSFVDSCLNMLSAPIRQSLLSRLHVPNYSQHPMLQDGFAYAHPVKNYHFQLHNSLVCLDEHTMITSTTRGVDVIDLKTGRHRTIHKEKQVSSLAFLASSSLLAQSGNELVVKKLGETRALPFTLGWEERMISRCVFFYSGGRDFLGVCGNNPVQSLFDLETQQQSLKLVTGENTNDFALCDSRNLFATAEDQPLIKLLDLRTGRPCGSISGSTKNNFAVLFLCENRLAFAGESGNVLIADLRNMKVVEGFPRSSPVYCLCYDQSSQILFSQGSSNLINAQDLKNKKEDFVFHTFTSGSMALTPSARKLVATVFERNKGLILEFNLC